jgi:hypothetical protein
MKSDPLGFGGGINKYVYVMNLPTDWTDPAGLAMSSAECLALLKDIEERTNLLAGGPPYRDAGAPS